MNCQISSPVLPGSTLAWLGSACSIWGNLSIKAACFFSSGIVPRTISCLSLPSFFSTKRMVSPLFTAMLEGMKRIVSFIATSTVRLTFFASPGLPIAEAWPCALAPGL